MIACVLLFVGLSMAVDYAPNLAQWNALQSILLYINENSVNYLLTPAATNQYGANCPDTTARTMIQCDSVGNIVMFTAFNKGFKGDLSRTNWAALTALQYINVASNELYGTIPSSISSLKSLKYLYIQRNNLRGPLKQRIGTAHLNLTDCLVAAPPYATELNCFDEQLDGNPQCGGAPNNIMTSCPSRDYVIGKTDYTNFPVTYVPPTTTKVTFFPQTTTTLAPTPTQPTAQPVDGSTVVQTTSPSTTIASSTTTTVTTTTTATTTTLEETTPSSVVVTIATASLPEKTSNDLMGISESTLVVDDDTPIAENSGWIAAFTVAVVFGVIALFACIFTIMWYTKKSRSPERQVEAARAYIEVDDIEESAPAPAPKRKNSDRDDSTISMDDVMPHTAISSSRSSVYGPIQVHANYSVAPPLRSEYDQPDDPLHR